MDVLQEELAFFEEKKPELLKTHPGQFALIKGRVLIGIFPTREEAYTQGANKFGSEAFLIKQIVEKETPEQTPLLAFTLRGARL